MIGGFDPVVLAHVSHTAQRQAPREDGDESRTRKVLEKSNGLLINRIKKTEEHVCSIEKKRDSPTCSGGSSSSTTSRVSYR